MGSYRQRRPSTTLLSLLLACLFLATARAAVLGIDIGTSYIKAVLVKPGIPLDIVLTKDSKRKESAALAFKPGAQPADSTKAIFPERLYGGDALAVAARFPSDVFSNVKPLLGLRGDDASSVGAFSARYPGINITPCESRDAFCVKSGAFVATEPAFAVEELLAMELQNVKANAKAFAGKGSKVDDAVITIPAFYTAREKQAVQTAAELAGLTVLSMTTDGLAVGLNYATTRSFPTVNEGGKPEYHLVYDMGAGSAKATVLKFQGRSVKDVGRFNKTIQEVQVMGAGWDKSLGGDALNALILDDMVENLAKNKQMERLGAGSDAIRKHGRTVAKLWKEAERLRQVLSANQETQASFEGIYDDDVNFKYKIKRSEFERMAGSFLERAAEPIVKALDMAKLEAADIESLILHGGAVRTPFIQKALEKAIGKASKVRSNVNSDEAAAFGAAFKAAGMSPSFRVKEIRASEVAIMPVTVSWSESKTKPQKLFIPTSVAGVEKTIPVRAADDFSFSFSQTAQGPWTDSMSIPVSSYSTTNFSASLKELDKHECSEGTEQAQLLVRLSPVDGLPEAVNGSFSCESVELVKKGGVVNNVKGLFGWSKKDDQEVMQDRDDEPKLFGKASRVEPKSKTKSSNKAKATDKAASSSSAGAEEPDASAEAEVAPKRKKVVIPFGIKIAESGSPRISADDISRMQARMKAFDKSDRDRKVREEAINNLEGYTYRVRDLIDDESFVAASTASERATIQEKSSTASEWLYGDGSDATTETLKARLKELRDLVEPIQSRKDEASQRPQQIEALRSSIQQTKTLLETMRESMKAAALAEAEAASASSASSAEAEASAATPDVEPADADASDASGTASEATFKLEDLDEDPFASPSAEAPPAAETPAMQPLTQYTEEDLSTLTKASEDVEKWLNEKEKAQGALKVTDEPAFKVKDLKTKGEELNQLIWETLSKQMQQSKPRREKNNGERAKKMEKGKSKGKKGKETKPGKQKESTDAKTKAADHGTKDEL